MNSTALLHLLGYSEPILCLMLLGLILRSNSAKSFASLIALLSTRALSAAALNFLIYSADRGIERHVAYHAYFFVYWASYALEAILSLLVIYSIFRLAMAPLKGLQTLGMLVFRWAAAISLAVAVGIALNPQLTGHKFIVAIVTQLQQTSSVLTLCLLLFVCFAIRPMGLSYGSRIFGVSIGLGVLAATDLVRTAWLSHSHQIDSTVNLISGFVLCSILLTWSAYFTFAEPKRRIIVLPTTSPFLRWNQIAQALGDDPGFVAVAGVSPDVFAPAEIEIMRRASAKMPKLEIATETRVPEHLAPAQSLIA